MGSPSTAGTKGDDLLFPEEELMKTEKRVGSNPEDEQGTCSRVPLPSTPLPLGDTAAECGGPFGSSPLGDTATECGSPLGPSQLGDTAVEGSSPLDSP